MRLPWPNCRNALPQPEFSGEVPWSGNSFTTAESGGGRRTVQHSLLQSLELAYASRHDQEDRFRHRAACGSDVNAQWPDVRIWLRT